MQTTTINLYSFNELSEKAKEKACEELSQINLMDEWYEQDGLLDLNNDEMQRIGVELSPNWYNSQKIKNVHGNIIGEYPAHTGLINYTIDAFSLDRGAYLQFKDIQIMDNDVFRKFLRLTPELWEKVSYRFVNDREQNTALYLTEDGTNTLTDDDQNQLENAEAIFSDKVNEALEMLIKQHEHLQSVEACADTAEANGYTFEEDGTMRNA